MNLFSGIKHALHSARKLEVILLAALIAAAGLLLMGNKDSRSADQPDIETRLESVLGCVAGAGRVKAAVNQDDSGGIIGVVVVSEGAGDLKTYLDIQNAVHTFTGADVSDIEIFIMEEGI